MLKNNKIIPSVKTGAIFQKSTWFKIQDSSFSKIWCYIFKHNMVKKQNSTFSKNRSYFFKLNIVKKRDSTKITTSSSKHNLKLFKDKYCKKSVVDAIISTLGG